MNQNTKKVTNCKKERKNQTVHKKEEIIEPVTPVIPTSTFSEFATLEPDTSENLSFEHYSIAELKSILQQQKKEVEKLYTLKLLFKRKKKFAKLRNITNLYNKKKEKINILPN